MATYFSGNVRETSASFEEKARRLASWLKQNGVELDGAVAVFMRNDIDYLIIMEACRYAGARYVALNWHLAPAEINAILLDSKASVLIGHSDLMSSLDGYIPETIVSLAVQTPDHINKAYRLTASGSATNLTELLDEIDPFLDPAPRMRGLFAYTSGSTGMPKGIKRALDPNKPDTYIVYQGLARGFMHTNAGDRFFVAAPMYHSAPNALAMMVAAVGDVDIFIEPKFDPEAFLKCVSEHRITHAYIVPTMMVRLLKLPDDVKLKYDISSLRYTVGTGSPCPVDVKQAMIDWMGPIFNESYGASEIGFMTLVSSMEAEERPGTVGKILPGGSIRILDDDMNQLPVGEIGTIYVNLPTFGAFEYTNAKGDIDEQKRDGFTTVGDMGYLDEDGYLFICDRKKDMIISGGANIFPAEIEAEIIKLPEVSDCAVFGAPDPEFGEKIVAAITLVSGTSLSLDDLKTQLKDRLASFKMPRVLDIHDTLPREDSGKIFKARLRAPYWENEKRTI
jgi:long-chain acyl-CoA synthetase